jgi:hypothetical protein
MLLEAERTSRRFSEQGGGDLMGARERVRDAIQAPVDVAEQELRELQDADTETRLTVLIDGWARGLAGALEELAIAVDELERRLPEATAPEERAAPEIEEPATESDDRDEEIDLAGEDEDRLAEEARRSRAATAELHEAGEEARRELER